MSATLILSLAPGVWADDFGAGSQHQAGAGSGSSTDEFAAGDRLLYHFLSTANLLYFASISAIATSAT